ncbi:MAG TPA: hypothetical protein PLN31_00555 [Azoarcus taiwanensis]|nr:hypothetical protein [Azoarcus taiwanensis]
MDNPRIRPTPLRRLTISLIVCVWLGYSGALLGWWAYTSPASEICFAPRS